MLEVLTFLFKEIANFIAMLFSINLGFMSLGMFFSVAFIGVPAIIMIFRFLMYKGGD